MHTNHLRILCISPAFPPLADSEAFCSGKMTLALKDAGADVVVLYDSRLSKGRKDNSSCWRPLSGITYRISTAGTWNKPWALLCGLRYGTVRMGRTVRDYMERAKSLHRQKSFDIVYSRSLPMYAHIIGYWCSRAINVPWIANINDPWDIHLFPEVKPKSVARWYASVSRYWLCTTLRSADIVTYPSSQLYQFHIQLAGIKHNAEVLSHIGYSVNSQERVPSEFRIVHAGKLGARELTGGRSAAALFTGLAQFLKDCPSARDIARVVLVGPEDRGTNDLAKKLGLGDIVKCVGCVSYEESLKYIASAAICVLLEGRMAEGIYFPSKLADYIAAGKPVLALSPDSGVVTDLAQQGGIRRVDPDDESAIAAAIGDLYQAFMHGELARLSPPDALVCQVSSSNVAKKFLDAVESVCRRSA